MQPVIIGHNRPPKYSVERLAKSDWLVKENNFAIAYCNTEVAARAIAQALNAQRQTPKPQPLFIVSSSTLN